MSAKTDPLIYFVPPPFPEEDHSSFYEILDEIKDESGEVTLVAGFTANNGIRIGLLDKESNDPDWREFDFNVQQAEIIGHALLRWARRSHNETLAIDRLAVNDSGHLTED